MLDRCMTLTSGVTTHRTHRMLMWHMPGWAAAHLQLVKAEVLVRAEPRTSDELLLLDLHLHCQDECQVSAE
jgi:hypothetical protein